MATLEIDGTLFAEKDVNGNVVTVANTSTVSNLDVTTVMTLPKLASDPASPVEGQLYYNTTDNFIKVHGENGHWSGAKVGSLTVSSTDTDTSLDNNVWVSNEVSADIVRGRSTMYVDTNQPSTVGGYVYHSPVDENGYLDSGWGRYTISLYHKTIITNPGASGSFSWTSSDPPEHYGNKIVHIRGDAGHTQTKYLIHGHCCRNDFRFLAGVSTYATWSWSNNSTNAGPWTLSWSGINFTTEDIHIYWYSWGP